MKGIALAHSAPAPGHPGQDLADHLKNVAKTAGNYASVFDAREWGERAGLWHDVGKYAVDFQDYLRAASDASSETQHGRVDHSSAGAQHAVDAMGLLGHVLAYAIAGHHSGLLDGRSSGTGQEDRLQKDVPVWRHGLAELPTVNDSAGHRVLFRALARRDPFAVAFFTRMVFSCLVDADFLDTEAFVQGGTPSGRGGYPSLDELVSRLERSLNELQAGAGDTPVNRRRKEVRATCSVKAAEVPGFFSLTVPTGGGKTLASLEFALGHARKHGLRRVVYVAPFTSIIEQNAEVFRRHLGAEAVLEHHCNLDPEKESTASRLAAENWDAPLIVTTSVQFYESLFANRPSACRKLHRLARSVVILDEAQTLPVDLLRPCLRALETLVRDYGATVVLCTATQPEIRQRPEFEIGLRGVREIISDPETLYASMRRVDVADIGTVSDAMIAEKLRAEDRALCVVNTTGHARSLFAAIGESEAHFHLSARMCPAHRSEVLARVRERLGEGAVCRVISTQVVEAGVDIDFPVVFRALAGLDSIAQAAGRCNRNGLLRDRGRVYVFRTEHASANRYFAETANCASMVMELHRDDPLALAAVERYFKLYYWDQRARWDVHDIVGHFRLDGTPGGSLPLDFDFATVGEVFRLIDDGARCTVIVPWGTEGRDVCARLRAMPSPTRAILREAQRFVVQVRPGEWSDHAGRDIKLLSDSLGILESPDTHYDVNTGLDLEARGPGSYFG